MPSALFVAAHSWQPMISEEQEPKTLQLAPSESHRIIILTGSALRHQRFALRIQKEFGNKVVAWYTFKGEALNIQKQSFSSKLKTSIHQILSGVKSEFRKFRYARALFFPLHHVIQKIKLRSFFAEYFKAEESIFRKEVERLKTEAHLTPKSFTKKDLKAEAFIAELKAHDAYFLLTLGGPVYPIGILNTVNGICLNQHAGHSPEYKGSFTTEWALYHRDIEKISNTVHITTPGADSGPIVKRSQPCFGANETAATAFSRVVALGTELMIDAVHEIIAKKEINVYPQPQTGRTYKAKDFDDPIAFEVYKTTRHQFINKTLNKYRNF